MLRLGNWKRIFCRFLGHNPWDPPGSERSECRRCGRRFPSFYTYRKTVFMPLFGRVKEDEPHD